MHRRTETCRVKGNHPLTATRERRGTGKEQPTMPTDKTRSRRERVGEREGVCAIFILTLQHEFVTRRLFNIFQLSFSFVSFNFEIDTEQREKDRNRRIEMDGTGGKESIGRGKYLETVSLPLTGIVHHGGASGRVQI